MSEESVKKKQEKRSIPIWLFVTIAAVLLAIVFALTGVLIVREDPVLYQTGVTEGSYRYGTEAPMAMYDDVVEETAEVYDYEYDGGEINAAAVEARAANGTAGIVESSAKIIQTASVSLQTKDFEKAVSGLESLVSENGGYFESQYVDNASSGHYRTASYTVRVPETNLDTFLTGIGETSTVSSLSRTAEDVSETYYDTDARLETARIKLERLQMLLKDAKKMEDIITLEEAISDVEYDIDNYSGTLRHYDSLIQYSTVYINLSEVYEYVDTTPAPLTFGERIEKAFHAGLESVANVGKTIVLIFVTCWIYIVIIAVIVVLIIVIVKMCNKRNTNKKKQKVEQEP